MNVRQENDSMGAVSVPENKLWGAQTQRSLTYFSIGKDLMPINLIHAYGILKKACALVNADLGLLTQDQCDWISRAADEVAQGQLDDHFPLKVWMTGSGTQTNMNVNEVIANRVSQQAGMPLGSHKPIHPNDHVNASQSTNDNFPSAMHMTVAIHTVKDLLPGVKELRDGIQVKARAWQSIVKIGRTHMQDATPLTLGQVFSGYVRLLDESMHRIEQALSDVYALALGGTAVGTGINTHPEYAERVAKKIAELTGLPFVSAPNKFAVQGSHDALVMLSSALRGLAVSLFKIANDVRLMACGPRCGFNELIIPANEPGSSIMPGKVNPTQCEAMAMIAAQVMGNDVAVGMGGASGYLEMNVYKPLIISNLMQSIQIIGDGCRNFNRYLIEGTEPNHKQLKRQVESSLMLVTALSPVIGYDKASQVAHHAYEHDLSLRQACVDLGVVDEATFDRIVKPEAMTKPGLGGQS